MKLDSIRNKVTGWWRTVLAVVMAVAGLLICFSGNEQGNVVIIVLGFFLIVGGVFLFISKRGEMSIRLLPGKKLKEPANVLVIRPGVIEFDYHKKPPEHQQRCINDGRWYSVLMGKPKEKLREFVLPDNIEAERYFDPREFANPVSMPANKELFKPTPTLVKTIAVGVMGVAVGILGIVIIAMSGG